ncbi:hypothetical protein GRJ2_003138300 [Grus japonensis]|uniref:Glycerol kinase n=1 Tax=Grus japonensis TaxID=30415 RepID=A0ABC9YDE0_GRUJA
MGDFKHPDICWKGNTARHAQSRRFLQSINDNFLTQVVEEPTRRGVLLLLDLVLTNKEGLAGDVKVEGSLGCRDHEMVEFRILRGRSRAVSRITALDFRRANFGLFKDLLGTIPWDKVLEGKGPCERPDCKNICLKDRLLKRKTPPATECDKDDCRVVETFNLRKMTCRVMRHGVR